MVRGELTADKILESISPPQRPLVNQLRDLLRATQLTECVKWRNLTYVGQGNVVAIVSHRDHLNLQFFRGVELDDPRGLLEGTGKSMRHVKLRPGGGVPTEVLRELLRAAVRLDGRQR